MSLKDHPTIIVVPLLITAVGAAWTIGSSVAENRVKTLDARIAAYETSNSLHLPQLLDDLRKASQQLSSQLETSRELAKAKEDLVTAQKRVKELEPLEKKLREAESALKSLYTDIEQFTMKEGESRNLLGYEIALAVHYVYATSVRIRFDNKSESLEIGGEVTTTRNGKNCKLRLTGVSGRIDAANFMFIVSKMTNPPSAAPEPNR